MDLPREDIVELRSRVSQLEQTVKRMTEQLNPEQPYSLAANQQIYIDETRKELARLANNARRITCC
ncbi:hypothetical protein NIES4071_107970 (plasmid) [Calothrix sp. NIES-4071]|nr:hypothetical protein NIES4071_107970 [Calothrix sp. NIES-4071]BAZ64837.1 hypothetical protein NIES4105_105700 [Calothrix sp. NIES-4105]